MKKQYVKPVMESEVFVANEYIAACWMFSCGAAWFKCSYSDKITTPKGYEATKAGFEKYFDDKSEGAYSVEGVSVHLMDPNNRHNTSVDGWTKEEEGYYYHRSSTTSGYACHKTEISGSANASQ